MDSAKYPPLPPPPPLLPTVVSSHEVGEYGRESSIATTAETSTVGGGRDPVGGNHDDDDAHGNNSGSSNSNSHRLDSRAVVNRSARRWYELETDSDDDSDNSEDWEDEEDETNPFFGRCALRSLMCREDSRDKLSGVDSTNSGRGSSSTRGLGGCCTGECGRSRRGREDAGECDKCRAASEGDLGLVGPASGIDLFKISPLPRTARNKPPPALLREGLSILNLRRRGWGGGSSARRVGGGASGVGAAATTTTSAATTTTSAAAVTGIRDEEEGEMVVSAMGVQRPSRQALV